uniref:GAG-pre-integrase domain-containing protein n=1 Tax=Fagus sylvatica TaxID=28930 RepID=A0A2N9ILA7_FAGSY
MAERNTSQFKVDNMPKSSSLVSNSGGHVNFCSGGDHTGGRGDKRCDHIGKTNQTKPYYWVIYGKPNYLNQDLKIKKMIGSGHEKDGLYYLHPDNSASHTFSASVLSATVSPLQWHFRSGHPSLAKLKFVIPTLSHVPSLECEACQLGKYHVLLSHLLLVCLVVLSLFMSLILAMINYLLELCLSPDLISSREGERSFLSPTLPIPLSSSPPQVPLASPPNPPLQVPTPSSSIPKTDDLPIALRRGRCTCTQHPIAHFMSYNRVSPCLHSGWKHAMNEEMNALHKNQILELTALPSGKQTVGCR